MLSLEYLKIMIIIKRRDVLRSGRGIFNEDGTYRAGASAANIGSARARCYSEIPVVLFRIMLSNSLMEKIYDTKDTHL